jgi:AcrR family transcriptional regulator
MKEHQVTRRTQQERRATTERRVLDAAIALIARSGSRAVSLAEVGRDAGYSRGIVNHHFGSRAQLLEAVVRDAQQFDVPESDGTGLARITALISTYVATLHERGAAGRAFLLLWAEAVGSDPVLAPLFAERDEWFRGLLADHLRTGIDDGSVRADVDPEAVALALVGLVRGVAMQVMSTATDARADRLAVQVTALVTGGLTAVGQVGRRSR